MAATRHVPDPRKFNILISSAGRRVVLARLFRAGLAELGLPGEVMAADISPLSAAYCEAGTRFLVPRCTDPEFVPALLERCIEHDIRLVVPTIDTELPILAETREQFAAVGTTVAVSGPATVRTGQDKLHTHEWLERAGLPTVRQWTPETAPADPACYPLIAKPRFGSSSIGVHLLHGPDGLEPLRKSDYVIEEIARGNEHTVDVYVDRGGALVCAIPRRRLETRAGEVSKGVTVAHRGLLDLAGRVVAALDDAYGVLNFQCFVDPETDRLAVIELNARFGGGFPLSDAAGAHVPRWMVEDLAGLTSTATRTFTDGLVMLRFDDAVFTTRDALGPGVA